MGGVSETQFTDWTVAVDKLDKVGVDGVIRVWRTRTSSVGGQPTPQLVALREHNDPMAALDALSAVLEGQASGATALESVRDLIQRALDTGVKQDALRVDPLLARDWTTTRAPFLKSPWTMRLWAAFAVGDATTT